MEIKKTLNYNDIIEAWREAGDYYYLLENSITNSKVVYKGFEGFSTFLRERRMYGEGNVRIHKLDKAIGEVLYGNAIQDK